MGAILRRLIFVGIILLVIGMIFVYDRVRVNAHVPAGYYRVTYVFDGDTIEVDMNGTREKVRMIGVDTPETHHPDKGVQCYGVLASDFTKSHLDGTIVRLESDETNQNRDRYQRLLRYVYTESGELWNAKLVSEGYGHALIGFPFTKMTEFVNMESLAKQKGSGLWSACE